MSLSWNPIGITGSVNVSIALNLCEEITFQRAMSLPLLSEMDKNV